MPGNGKVKERKKWNIFFRATRLPSCCCCCCCRYVAWWYIPRFWKKNIFLFFQASPSSSTSFWRGCYYYTISVHTACVPYDKSLFYCLLPASISDEPWTEKVYREYFQINLFSLNLKGNKFYNLACRLTCNENLSFTKKISSESCRHKNQRNCFLYTDMPAFPKYT